MGGRKLLKTKYVRSKPITKLTTLINTSVDGRVARHVAARVEQNTSDCGSDSEYDEELDIVSPRKDNLEQSTTNNIKEEKLNSSKDIPVVKEVMPKKVSVIEKPDMNIEPQQLYKMLDQYFESRDKLKTVKRQKDISEKEKQKLERKAERERLAAAKAEAKKAERELELARIKEELRAVVLQKEKEQNEKLLAVKRNANENISKLRSGLYSS